MSENDDRLANLEGRISELAARVAGLEGRERKEAEKRPDPPAAAPVGLDLELLERLQGRSGPLYEEGDERGAVLYAGSARFGDRSYVWQVERSVPGLLGVEKEPLASVISALASTSRLRLLKELLRGAASNQQLQEALGEVSVGQLYHHLKELQASGLIAQKRRGSYEIKTQAVIPLLAILAASYDLADHRGRDSFGGLSEGSANEG
jgi:DNA-binding transcriptional ArsR family regulator